MTYEATALLMFSTSLSLSGFVQYANVDHLGSGNFRLRWNPREGVDLFVVYNEGLISRLSDGRTDQKTR